MKTLSGTMLALAAISVQAQTHAVKKQDAVVRALAVYEWTGDLAKPTASRLVPVSLYINHTYEDAGIYLARPVPFALETGTVFELEKSGIDEGTLELAFARHIEAPQDAPGLHVDDGWFAYGAFKPKPAEPVVLLKKSGPLSPIVVSGGKETPASDKSTDSAKTVDRKDAAGAGTTVSASAPPPVRPIDDEPSKKGDPDSDSAKDDPDRPTLKKRSVAERRAAQKRSETASVKSGGDLNDDPDRPNLHRGKPTARLEDEDLPPLHGLPADMHQMIAVSDAKNRPEHDFARAWESPEEQEQVRTAMRQLAQAKLAGYRPVVDATPPTEKKPPVISRRGPRPAPAVVAPAAPMFDTKTEDLKAYTLSYGGAATYVYSASTPDAKTAVLVTIVAQREPDGSLKSALANVTDAAHLDRTPQLRLLDAVDPDASNRASLLFERRGATTRDFVLYRVIGAQAEQTLVAGAN